MKKLLSVLISFFSASVLCVSSQTAEMILRPEYVDLSSPDSYGALLVHLSGYSSNDVRYRLFNGSSQYNCWNAENGCFVSSNTYSAGPLVTGSAVTGTSFWILYKRGSNKSVTATYRDRLGPDYSVNYQSVALPSATEIVNGFFLTGKMTENQVFPLTKKYVVLAWSGSALVATSHTELTTGEFSVACPTGVTIEKIEVRTINNDLVGAINGTWDGESGVGEIVPGMETKIFNPEKDNIKIYPVPVHDWLRIENALQLKTIEIYNITGKKVFAYELRNENNANIDLRHLLPGIYLIKLKAQDVDIVKKLIKD